MTSITWPTRLIVFICATLAAIVLTLAFAGPHAGAAPTAGGAKSPVPGDNGTVKIHNSTTPVTDPRNEPHVCVFYLDAFGFDAGQSVSWQIKSWPPTGDRSVVSSGLLTLDGGGAGFTGDMTLPDGHYKLLWNFTGENGLAKQKVFWVACTTPSPTPNPTSPPPGCGSGCPTSPPPSCSSGCPTSPPPSCQCSPSPSGTPTPTVTHTPRHHHPSPGPSSTPPSPPSGGGLPITGWPLALIAAAGVALLGTGGTAMVAARRRRS